MAVRRQTQMRGRGGDRRLLHARYMYRYSTGSMTMRGSGRRRGVCAAEQGKISNKCHVLSHVEKVIITVFALCARVGDHI